MNYSNLFQLGGLLGNIGNALYTMRSLRKCKDIYGTRALS